MLSLREAAMVADAPWQVASKARSLPIWGRGQILPWSPQPELREGAALRRAQHLREETWRGLEFALRDSQSARRFARVDATWSPKKSALQATMGSVSADTWERINRRLLRTARDAGMERATARGSTAR